jgi:hypothetical protein
MGELRERYKEPYSQQADCIISLALMPPCFIAFFVLGA